MYRIIAILILTSCATTQPRLMRWNDGAYARLCSSDQIQIFTALTQDNMVVRTREAAALWNSWIGRDLFSVTDKAVVIIDGESWVSVSEKNLSDPRWRGLAQLSHRNGNCGSYGSVNLAPESEWLTDLQITAIIAHELGHLLGLQHTPFASDLMWPYIHTSKVVLFHVPKPAEEQLEWVRRVWME